MIGDVAGRSVILVDDLTETAGTLTAAAKILKQQGAKEIMACVSHAVLSDVGITRLQGSEITELVCTNSVPVREVEGFKITPQCIAPLLGEAINRITGEESVSSLFQIPRT